MTKNDRLIILKFINLHRQIVKEAQALGIKGDISEFIKNHPDFEYWNKLKNHAKKLDPKWTLGYIQKEVE